MEEQHPTFNFALEYAGNTVNCEVIMKPNAYDVVFEGRWMASIEHTEDWTWMQASGVILPDTIIAEIGFQIESQYA